MKKIDIKSSVALVTGANRGIGEALVRSLLAAGVSKVYAAARDPRTLGPLAEASAGRVVPLTLDITRADQVSAAAARATDVNLLFNNAGVLASGSVLDSPVERLAEEMTTNYFGTLAVTRALLPAIERAAGTSGGAVVNLLTVVSLAAMPGIGGYSASKAAAFSLTQSLRGQLSGRGVAVHAVFPGPIDTDMSKAITLPKTSAAVTADNIVAGVIRGDLDILPDPMSQQVYQQWTKSPLEVAAGFAGF